MIELEWIPVEGSERISAMAYDSATETIYVQFPKGGTQWHYDGCPPHLWSEFVAAPSKGQYIHQVLNNRPNGRVA